MRRKKPSVDSLSTGVTFPRSVGRFRPDADINADLIKLGLMQSGTVVPVTPDTQVRCGVIGSAPLLSWLA